MTDEELTDLYAEIDGFLESCEHVEKYKKIIKAMDEKMAEQLPELKQKVKNYLRDKKNEKKSD